MAELAALARRRADWLLSAVLVLAVGWYAFRYIDFAVPPFEDAAMLMRYSEHLAHGYGVVWNVGDRPVDGATDFLFMAAVASLIRLGAATGRAVRILGVAAHFVTVLLVYWANRRLWRASPLISFITALYLGVGTGLWYVSAYFGTPVFALMAAATWVLGLLAIRSETAHRSLSIAFSIAAVLLGMTRPEGVLLSVFMLIGLIVLRGTTKSRFLVSSFLMVMLILGGAYFFWHWSYFGYPLPNPFYKKGAGLLHWDSFGESFGYLAEFGGPFLIAYLLGIRGRNVLRMSIAFAIPLVLFAASFILVSNETNFGGRFQYALWPMVLLSYFPLVAGIPSELRISWPRESSLLARISWPLAGLVVALALLRYGMTRSCFLTIDQRTCGVAYEADGRYDVATYLNQYKDKGYVLVTSEAGLLPLYSGWRSVDAWGLNDEWIAHHLGIDEAYLDSQNPALIVFHAYYSPLIAPRINEKNMQQAWFRMTITLKSYAESHGYVLAAAFGDSPYESHYYYVRPDFPDSDRIIRELRGLRTYAWYATGRKAINYALLQP